MDAKKIVVGISCAALVAAAGLICLLNLKEDVKTTEATYKKEVQNQAVSPVVKKQTHKIADMYNSTVYDIPLYSIVQISEMPKALKEAADKALEEAQGLYLLKYNQDEQKVFMILQNQLSITDAFPRHNLEFMELYLNSEDGKVLKNMYSPAYMGQGNESFFAVYSVHGPDEAWELDKNVSVTRPLKHTYFDQKGKIKNQEIWNYDESKDIKYQFKSGNKKVISMLKESKQGDSGLRKEHLFYDSDGNLMLSLSVNYDGANVTRLMYFDKHNMDESMSIVTHYVDGMKVKEEIFGNDYKLKNIIEAEYQDGERKRIKSLNLDGEVITEIGK